MKKVILVLGVVSTVGMISCGGAEKDFCECTEIGMKVLDGSMSKEEAEDAAKGCEYINDMDKDEAAKKAAECLKK